MERSDLAHGAVGYSALRHASEAHFPEEPSAQDWLTIMDRHKIEVSYLFPTRMLSASTVKDPRMAVRLCRAYNEYAHDEYTKVSPRLKPLALISNQDPVEGARELNRAVKKFGCPGGFFATTGLRFPLGHHFYDPIYEEANRLGCVIRRARRAQPPARSSARGPLRPSAKCTPWVSQWG